MSGRGEICYKPGCGAANKVGDPCTDWDCPQRFVSVADYASLKAALASSQEEIARLRKALEPFAEVASWYGPDEDDAFEVWQDYPHGLIKRTVAQLKHYRAAARALASQPVPEHGGKG